MHNGTITSHIQMHKFFTLVLPLDFAHMNMMSKSMKMYTFFKDNRTLYHFPLFFCYTTFSHPREGIVIK